MSSQPPWSDTDDRPRDLFDDVPEDGRRQGAHRPREAARAETPAGLKAMVVVGSLGLLLGTGAYVWSTVHEDRGLAAGPAATPSASSAAAEPEAEASASESAPATTAPEDAEQVGVFNATEMDGVAGAAGSELSALEWEIIATGNWGLPVEESVVYYARDGVTGDTEEQAQQVADALGIEQIQADDAIAYPLVAVIGDDVAQDLLDRAGDQAGGEQGAAQAEPAPDAVEPPQDQADAPAAEAPADDAAGGSAPDPAVDDAGQQPVQEVAPAAPAPPADGGAPVEQAPGVEAPADQQAGF